MAPGCRFLALVTVVVCLGARHASPCAVGEREEQQCGADSVCCRYRNTVDPNMVEWSCFPSMKNATAHQICDKLNGTATSGGTCFAGELTNQTCGKDASCCCSYKQNSPSGSIEATVCTSAAVCSVLKGKC